MRQDKGAFMPYTLAEMNSFCCFVPAWVQKRATKSYKCRDNLIQEPMSIFEHAHLGELFATWP
jgi:hypothetical protein